MKILVFRIGQLGDTIVSLPVLHALREQWPDAQLSLLFDSHLGKKYVVSKDLFRSTDIYNEFISYPVGSGKWQKLRATLSLLPLVLRLRKKRFDLVINLAPGIRPPAAKVRDTLFFRLCGIRKIVTAADFRAPEDKTRPLKPLPHEADVLLACLRAVGIEPPAPGTGSMSLCLNQQDETEYSNWLQKSGLPQPPRRWIGLGIGSKMQAKLWPIESYIELCRRLIRDCDVFPIIAGGPEDREAGDQLLQACGRGYNCAGELSLRGSARLLRECMLYIGNDTGTMHLAVSEKTPCVGIFSARDFPNKWYPYGNHHTVHRVAVDCEGCMLTECITEDRKCLRSISVDAVYRSCVAYLGKADGSHQQPAHAQQEKPAE